MMNMPYKELLILEQQFLPLVFLYWKKGARFVLQNFLRYCRGFDSTLSNLDFSMHPMLQPPVFIYPRPGDKIVKLSFPFTEDMAHIGLSRNAYVVHDKDFQNMRYFSAEAMRDYSSGGIRYFGYEYFVECFGAEPEISKKFLGSYFLKDLDGLKLKDEHGLPFAMLD